MSRSMIPSQSQLEKLADMFVQHQFLATGHARTAHARDRTRAAWQEVASALNSEGNGCIKTWQQWAKYWKDKKAAFKKKVSQLHQARRRTGGGAVEEEIHLTAVEERLLALVGGEGFAIGDRELEINPFENPTDEPEPLPQTPPQAASHSPAILLTSINDEPSINSESILQGLSFPAESMVVQAGTEPLPGPSRHIDSQPQLVPTPIMESNQGAPETRGQRRHATSATSSPRRRRMPQARRRLLQRTPPAQRNSQMASLTERFISIEERRVEVEMVYARSMETLAQSFDRTSHGFLQQSQALQSLADSIRIILERHN